MSQSRDPQQYWHQSSLTFKCSCLTSTILFITFLLLPTVSLFFIDNPLLTIYNFQIWKLLVSMFGEQPQKINVVSIVLSFIWIYRHIDDRPYSTVYRFFEIFIINFEIHVIFNILCIILFKVFGSFESIVYLGFGFFPLVLVYEFRKSALDPDGTSRFCFLPFEFKNTHYPWFILLVMMVFTQQVVCFIASAIVGYFQESVRKDMFIKLPIGFYRTIDSWVPQIIRKRHDYVIIGFSNPDLESRCCGWKGNNQNATQNNPNIFPRDNNIGNNRNERENDNPVESFDSKPEAIGGNQRVDFKNHWANKNQNQRSTQVNSNNRQMQLQIEPRISEPQSSSHKINQEEGTYVRLHEENQSNLSEEKAEKKSRNQKKADGDSDLI